jgi:hypothetical protein
MGTLIACLDATLRRIGGVPAYLLGDNAKLSPWSMWPAWRCGTRPWWRPDGTTARPCIRASRSIRSPRAAWRPRCASPRPTSYPPRRTCYVAALAARLLPAEFPLITVGRGVPSCRMSISRDRVHGTPRGPARRARGRPSRRADTHDPIQLDRAGFNGDVRAFRPGKRSPRRSVTPS